MGKGDKCGEGSEPGAWGSSGEVGGASNTFRPPGPPGISTQRLEGCGPWLCM